MRYVTYVLTPQRGYFDYGEKVMRENGVTPRSILDTDILNDGSIVNQLEVSGDHADIRRCFTPDGETVLDVQAADTGDTYILQLHYVPSTLNKTLFEIHRNYPVLIDYPLEYVDPENGTLRVSVIGPEEELSGIITETQERVDVTIEQLGSYDPTAGRLFAELTRRQREVLETAIEEGYYEVPRKVTHEDIAPKLDCAAGTVGQHLRRIESKVMTSLLSGEVRDEPTVTSRP